MNININLTANLTADDVKAIVPIANNIAKNKLIETYWTQMTADDIDSEIKEIIKSIIA